MNIEPGTSTTKETFSWTQIAQSMNAGSLPPIFVVLDYKGQCGWLRIRNNRFLPLWARSEFTWIDTGTNRNHKTKEFAKKAVKTRKETNKWL